MIFMKNYLKTAILAAAGLMLPTMAMSENPAKVTDQNKGKFEAGKGDSCSTASPTP